MNWETLQVGKDDCSISKIVGTLQLSSVSGLVFEKLFSLQLQLGLKLSKMQGLPDEEKLYKTIECWVAKKGKNATLKAFTDALKILDLNDFAQHLESEFSQAIDDRQLKSPQSTEYSKLNKNIRSETKTCAQYVAKDSENDAVNGEKMLMIDGISSSQQSMRKRRHPRFSIGVLIILFIILGVVLVLITFLVLYQNRHFAISQESVSTELLKVLHDKKISDSEILIVYDYEEYSSRMSVYDHVKNLSLSIVILNKEQWPRNGSILFPHGIREFKVSGPIDIQVVYEFLSVSNSLEDLSLEYFNNKCDDVQIEFESREMYNPKKELTKLKLFVARNFSICTSFLSLITKSFVMPNLQDLKIINSKITDENYRDFEELLKHSIKLRHLEISASLNNTEKFKLIVNTRVLLRLRLNLKPTYEGFSSYPQLSDRNMLCDQLGTLEELISNNWFLPLEFIRNCRRLKILNITYQIENDNFLDSFYVISEYFPFMEALILVLNSDKKTACPVNGLVGLEDIKCAVNYVDIIYNGCSLKAESDVIRYMQNYKPEYC